MNLKSSKNKTKILVVDDVEANLLVMEKVLEKMNVEVVTARSGRDALALLLEHHCSIIIMDVQMPEMDGYETAKLIKMNDELKQIPIIFVTAINKEAKQITTGYDAGAVDYLFKPVDPNILRSKIRVFLEMHNFEQELIKRKNNIEKALFSVKDAVIILNKNFNIKFINQASENILGYKRSFLKHKNIFDFISFYDVDNNLLSSQKIKEFCNVRQSIKYEDKIIIKNHLHKAYTIEFGVMPIKENQEAVGLILDIQDISEKEDLAKQLHFQSTHDVGTGLANRYRFNDEVERTIQQYNGEKNFVFHVIYLNIYNLSSICSIYGFSFGDKIIAYLDSEFNRLAYYKSCFWARIDDDVMSVLVPDQYKKNILDIVTSILQIISRPFQIDDTEINLYAAIGIAIYNEDGVTAQDLMRNSALASSFAQAEKPNSFMFYKKDYQEAALTLMQKCVDIKRALKKQEFIPYYQPIIDISNRTIVGLEVLCRWDHPTRGILSPAEFIKICEENGLIIQLSEQLFDRAFEQYGYILKTTQHPIHISLNISVPHLYQDQFVDNLISSALKHNVPPDRIQLEITESVFIENIDNVCKILNKLRRERFSIAIDDYGTGYSSLCYLLDLPIDIIKIDQSFIKNIVTHDNNKAIVRSIIELSKSLHFKTIAEGIETNDQYQVLNQLNCDYAQGYYFSKPLSYNDLINYLHEKHLH